MPEDLVPNDSKVLGYVYSSKEDVIRFKNAYLDSKCNIKRKVLSAKDQWDDNLSTTHLRKWVKISDDFASSLDASEFSTRRMVAEIESPANLVVLFGCFQKQLRFCSLYSPGRKI